jgi:uncharacterized protein (TIGR02145 family)
MAVWDDCAKLETLESVCLADERDGKIYQVRKFADGKCWMVDNLAYGGANIASSPQDNSADYCADKITFSGYGSATYNTDWYNTGSTDNLYGDCRDPAKNNNGTDNTYCQTRHCGYLYNYQAVMQDINSYLNDYQALQPTQGLCPDGWHIPRGDFISLDFAIGGSGSSSSYYPDSSNDHTTTASYNFWHHSSWRPIYSGYADSSGTLSSTGTESRYWSSIKLVKSLPHSYLSLSKGSSYATTDPSSSSPNEKMGFSLRCLKN